MKHYQNNTQEDQFINRLIKESFVQEKPPENFNRILMDRVMYDWVSSAGYQASLIDKRNNWWIVPGVVLMLLIGYMIDIGRLGEQYVNKDLWFKGFSELGLLLFGWMGSMHWFIPASIAAVGAVLLFDRLLQKLFRF